MKDKRFTSLQFYMQILDDEEPVSHEVVSDDEY